MPKGNWGSLAEHQAVLHTEMFTASAWQAVAALLHHAAFSWRWQNGGAPDGLAVAMSVIATNRRKWFIVVGDDDTDARIECSVPIITQLGVPGAGGSGGHGDPGCLRRGCIP